MLEWIDAFCPYCGETFETAVDCSAGEQQEYIEDCQICCQPILFKVDIGPNQELLTFETRRED